MPPPAGAQPFRRRGLPRAVAVRNVFAGRKMAGRGATVCAYLFYQAFVWAEARRPERTLCREGACRRVRWRGVPGGFFGPFPPESSFSCVKSLRRWCKQMFIQNLCLPNKCRPIVRPFSRNDRPRENFRIRSSLCMMQPICNVSYLRRTAPDCRWKSVKEHFQTASRRKCMVGPSACSR